MVICIWQRFGRLTVIGTPQTKKVSKGYITYVRCKCDCGNEKMVQQENLMSGNTKSCGCLHQDVLTKHGLSNTPLFYIWSSIKHRCYNPKSRNYKYYGGNGIKMCDKWKNDFKTFYEWVMNNGWNNKLHIHRIDVYGDYKPENCLILTPSKHSEVHHPKIVYSKEELERINGEKRINKSCYMKEWRQEHPDYDRANWKRYYKENRKKVLAWHKKHYKIQKQAD